MSKKLAIQELKERGYKEDSKLSLKVVESLMERYANDKMTLVLHDLNKLRRECVLSNTQMDFNSLLDVFINHGFEPSDIDLC